MVGGELIRIFWTISLVFLKIFQHQLDLTSSVIVLAFVLDCLVNESSDHTVGHVLWHGLAARGAGRNMFPARTADYVPIRTAGNGKLSRNYEADGTLEVSLHAFNLILHRLVIVKCGGRHLRFLN